MLYKENRRSFTNFFIKRSIQLKITLQICLTFFLTAIFVMVALVLFYNYKAGSGHYFFADSRIHELKLINILGIILPSLLIAQIVTTLTGLAIGLFSSRKVAIPVYKFEKWLTQVSNGNLNTNLSFREDEQMDELSLKCNSFVEYYRKIFNEIDSSTTTIENHINNSSIISDQIRKIRLTLGRIEYK